MGKIEREKVGSVAILNLSGKFLEDRDGQKITDAVNEALEGCCAGVLVNFGGVIYMSSGSYGIFVGLVIRSHKMGQKHGIPVRFVFPDGTDGESYYGDLQHVKLDKLVKAFRNESDALKSFGESLDLANHFALALTVDVNGRIGLQVVDPYDLADVSETTAVRPAIHEIWLPQSTAFPQTEIEHFRELLNQRPPASEFAFQEFLQAHPRWLALLGQDYHHDRAVSLPPLELKAMLALTDGSTANSTGMPDFFVKRIGFDLWNILDLRPADTSITVGKQGHSSFSTAVADAIAQLRECARRLRASPIRTYLFERYRMKISEPLAMVVIGRDYSFSNSGDKTRLGDAAEVQLYTYDDLYSLATQRVAH